MCIFFIFVDLHILCELAFCHAYMYRTCPRNCIAYDAELLRPTKSTAFVYKFVLHLYFFAALAAAPVFMCVSRNCIAL